MKSVIIKTPATTANLGPGFDCLGIALDLWNELKVTEGDFSIEIEGEGMNQIPLDSRNLIVTGLEAVFNYIGKKPKKYSYICNNNIPFSRGLGSSSAAIVSGLLAGSVLSGANLDKEDLVNLASEIEGHPDNVAAAIYGGFTIGLKEQNKWIIDEVSIPKEVNAILFIPNFYIDTHQSRSNLPENISRSDVIYNIARVALLINSFNKQSFNLLNIATKDKIHKPYRSGNIPGYQSIVKGAIKGGASGVYISGSGPTIVAITRGKEVTVRYEMAEAARLSQVEGESIIVPISDTGAFIDSYE